MPVEDPTSGRVFIWLISFFLFITIAAGGSLLLMYVALPADPSRVWFPVAGIALVCLPWLFWVLTCFYRVLSRIFGFRIAVGSGNGGGGGGGAGGGRPNAFKTTGNAATDNEPAGNIENPGGDGRQDDLEGPMVMVEKNDSGGDENTAIKRNLSESNSINMSFRSHESELPLTSSMAC